MIIAPYSDASFNAVFAIYEASMRDVVEQAFGWDVAFQQDGLTRAIRSGSCRLGIEGDACVGFILWRVSAEDAHLTLLCVAPAHQRRGYGSQLLESLIQEIQPKRLPLKGLLLNGNMSKPFYLHHGFTFSTADNGLHLLRTT